MPSSVGGDLLFCCGTSSALEPKRGRPLQHPAKKPPHDNRKQPKVLSSPRTDDDMEKMVDVLRQSLQLNKPATTPTTLPHGVVKRRVYLSPRERVHNSTIRHNMSVHGATPAAIRPLPSEGIAVADKLPTIAKQLEPSKATPSSDPDERAEESPNQSPSTSMTTSHLTQSKSVDDIMSNNANDGAAVLDHSKSCNDLESIRSQLAFGGFHVEFEEPETTEDSAPSSPMGPWLKQGEDVQYPLAPASSPRTRLLSLSVDPTGGGKDVRRVKPAKAAPTRKKTSSSKKKPAPRPTSSASSANNSPALDL